MNASIVKLQLSSTATYASSSLIIQEFCLTYKPNARTMTFFGPALTIGMLFASYGKCICVDCIQV